MMDYRINGFEQIKSFYSWVFNNQDKGITAQHISLYNFLINQNNRNNWVEWFKCPFDLAMAGSCIGNKKTYYKCLTDLQEWGLIDYQKGVNNWKAPLIKIEVLKCTATGTATVPQSEPLLVPLPIPLPTHIYKLLTNNIKLITDNFSLFENFIFELKNKDNKVKKIGTDKFDFSICEKEFEPIVREWIEYKISRKENYKSQMSFSKLYKNLFEYSSGNPEIAQRIIDKAMGNNWKGIFALKPDEMILDVDLAQSFRDAYNDREWVQNFGKNNKINEMRIKEMLSEFYRTLQNEGVKTISVDRLKLRFSHWYQKEIK